MRKTEQPGTRLTFFLSLFGVVLALRLCHSHILWADEDYHMAAAIQTLHGKLLYRDLWYDKPPLSAWIYAAWGAFPGWPLRLFGAVYVLAVCAAMYRFAREIWSDREGLLAAGLLGFFLSFDHAPAVMPLAPDLFMMLPHIAAVYCAWRKRALPAGLWCGVAFLFHTKGVFVLAMCLLLAWRNVIPLLAGFAIPSAAALAVLAWGGALNSYASEVWRWGLAYARNAPVANPASNALRRSMDWLGFHALLAIGAARLWCGRGLWKDWWTKDGWTKDGWIAAWCVLSFGGVALGGQFAPRYFLQLLPPLVLAASRGLPLLLRSFDERRNRLAWATVILAALVPLIRFGPRYALLATDLAAGRAHRWTDVVLDQDSRAAAAVVNERARADDTLFVWGYRPGVFVYTRLPAASMFWDSQPLTGVPADRHLFDARPILPEWAARNRAAFTHTYPTFVVDGLSRLNPRLAMRNYPELQSWLLDYSIVARTDLSIVYKRNEAVQARGLAGAAR